MARSYPPTAWHVLPVADLLGDARTVGVDGPSSSGKTTVAARLAAAVDGATVVHTDDIAWHQAVLDWVDLLVGGVLEPVARGEAVAFRPPAWDRRGRAGAIEVPAAPRLLVVEGVGAARPDLAPWYDLTLWVHSPREALDARNAERVAAGEISPGSFVRWMAEEDAFVAETRTWERVDHVVAGTPVVDHDPAREVVVGSVDVGHR